MHINTFLRWNWTEVGDNTKHALSRISSTCGACGINWYVQCYCCDANFILSSTFSVVAGRKLTPGFNSLAKPPALQHSPPVQTDASPAVSRLVLTGASCEADSRTEALFTSSAPYPQEGWVRWAASCVTQKRSPMCSSCSLPLLLGALTETRGHCLPTPFSFPLCQCLPQHLHSTSTLLPAPQFICNYHCVSALLSHYYPAVTFPIIHLFIQHHAQREQQLWGFAKRTTAVSLKLWQFY